MKKIILIVAMFVVQISFAQNPLRVGSLEITNDEIHNSTINSGNVAKMDMGFDGIKGFIKFGAHTGNGHRSDILYMRGSDGNVGVGTNDPTQKFSVIGTHHDSRFLLHSEYGGENTKEADLMLWASEPGWTYSGVGIGNNVHNFKTSVGGLTLLNTARGGSYIRLLDNSMLFNVISSSGLDKQALSISSEGNIGIGVTNPVNKLDVNGRIHSKEVKVDLDFPAPDYVFSNDYKLRSLEEVEDYVKKNSHLPEIPSAKEFEKNGVLLAEMNMALLKKVEELTLYMIEMKKDIAILKEENKALKEKK
ncbi:hypothetical protein [Flavobacterium tructae]|uniref:hypothetical protein n=1 Tax=Flavobacterium tructae TaxID=1114873 RepID=UPI0035A84195